MLRIAAFTGPMRSGKTLHLISAWQKHKPHFQQAFLIKPEVAGSSPISSRAQPSLSIPVHHCLSTLETLPATPGNLFAIDEAQFFDKSLFTFTERLLTHAQSSAAPTMLLLAGLDLDFRGQTFGFIEEVLQLGRQHSSSCTVEQQKLTATCTWSGGRESSGRMSMCGRPAQFTQRLKEGGAGLIVVGDSCYQPSCELHHSPEPADEVLWQRSWAA